jgi:hypothetical protein
MPCPFLRRDRMCFAGIEAGYNPLEGAERLQGVRFFEFLTEEERE